MPLPAELGRVVAGVARAFQLKRRVLDIEPVSQCSFDPFLHGVCVGPTPLGYDDMRIQCRAVFVHLPEMRVVNAHHAVDSTHGIKNRVCLDLGPRSRT